MGLSYRHRRMPDFRKGMHPRAEDLDLMARALESLLKAGAAGGLSRGTAGGVVLTDPAQKILRVRSPGGGIAARSGATPGSAACDVCTWDGTSWAVGSETLTVKNDYPTAVEATKLLWVVYWLGDYWVMTEECEA